MTSEEKYNAENLEAFSKEYYNKRLQDEAFNRVITLNSGRLVSYSEVGRKDGFPVFSFPGDVHVFIVF